MQIHELRDESGNVIHACATAAFPLPEDHWIYQEPSEVSPLSETDLPNELRDAVRLSIREAMKYTIQVCTRRGKDMDFDPDAMCQTIEHTLFNAKG